MGVTSSQPERDGSGEEATWKGVLDALEAHLETIRAGLDAACLPPPYQVPVPGGPVPPRLLGRARRILAAQHDLEAALRERLSVLSGVLLGSSRRAPSPLYLDRRN